MPNWVQNEIIFENANDEKVAVLIRELKLATQSEDRAFAMDVWGYTEDDFDDEEYETSYSDVIEEACEPEVTEVVPPETVDSGLSIFGLI